MKNIQISAIPYRHTFRKPFKIAHGERTGTDIVLIRLEYDGFRAYGEASLPPYLPDTVNSVIQFFQNPQFRDLSFPVDIAEFWHITDKKIPGNYPAKAALDMALWNLKSKIENKSLSEIFNIPGDSETPHTFTIGIGNEEDMLENMQFGISSGFRHFKLKLNSDKDLQRVEFFRSHCDLPFAVDINQAWDSLEYALETSLELQKMGCFLIEQPFQKSDRQKSKILAEALEIPLIADEACQGLNDIHRIPGYFGGINIKLQKCGGLSPAVELIRIAKNYNLKILIGCMSESNIACSAAEVLSPIAEWADLDGPWLIKENPNPEEVFNS